MNLITTQASLETFCNKLEDAGFITVDTEFIRERTYYPRLCLLQMAGDNDAACIDPLAADLDLAPVFRLLENPKILKVFHAGRQDIEIFYNLTGKVPAPVADTQIMAMVCGFGESVSYENLASKLVRAKIDKSSRFTDWAARPLSDKQLEYALADVTHLRGIFMKLDMELASKNRRHWIDEELAFLTDESIYKLDVNDAWERIRIKTDKPRVIARLQRLAAWREREAQQLNIPRGRVLKDETLQEIAFHPPHDMAQLLRMRGLPSGFGESRFAPAILQVIAEAEALKDSQLPVIEHKKPVQNDSLSATVELLRVLLRLVVAEHGVAAKLIAVSDELEEIASNDEADVPALKGWRYEIFGQQALELKHGRLALTLKNRKVVATAV
ncbi:MAG: ribonuclease D [Bdellovibrionales bacterium]